MNKEDVYLDLKECNGSQIRNIPLLLANSAEKLRWEDSLFLDDITNGRYLEYNIKTEEWITMIEHNDKIEISYPEFIALFESQYFNYNVFISNLQEN